MNKFKDAFLYLFRFLKNPIKEIQIIPDWNWQELVVIQLIVTAATGFAAGLVSASFLSVLYGILLMPIMTGITIGVASLCFYFILQVFAGITVSFRRLTTVVFLANVPFFIFQIIAHLFPPISLIGLGFASLILIVGLTSQFLLDRSLVLRLVSAIYVIFLILWLMSRFESSSIQKHLDKAIDAPRVELGR